MATPPGWGNPEHNQSQYAQYPPPYPPPYSPFGYQHFQYPEPGLIPLRPLTFGELIRAGVNAIRRYPGALLGPIALAVLAELVLLGAYVLCAYLVSGQAFHDVLHYAEPASYSGDGRPTPPDGEVVAFAVWICGGLALALLCQLALSACAQVVSATAAGRGAVGRAFTFTEALRELRAHGGRALRLYLFLLLLGLAVMVVAFGPGIGLAAATGEPGFLALLLLAFPAVALILFVGVRWQLAAPALVLERQPVREALRRSWRLTNGTWWRTLGLSAVCSLLAGVVVQIVQIPASIVGSALGIGVSGLPNGHMDGAGLVLVYAVPMAASLILQPVTVAFQLLPNAFLYIDQRIRRESLDTALAAEAGITWPPTAPVPPQYVPPQPGPPTTTETETQSSQDPQDSRNAQEPTATDTPTPGTTSGTTVAEPPATRESPEQAPDEPKDSPPPAPPTES
ncbi:glycerophosphoryl diester phosphodiesterase membrane domain-containing protein [Phaeacidiphilus oryzae]|uniref:glycerophosphoryl diester phosphodiesterase membrane domain-containing protein n=1 Tax=Phaeacidiphilus oryzae TaxID=348818 RepID=UPI00056553B6|nr:glycerophosphoryl diester phosphodiesterase membrane domain-containing protein [Phaeacidiphilus oryzae]